MKSFRFPLKSLRVLREQKERTAQRRYAAALRASAAAATRLDRGARELAASWQSMSRDVAGGATGATLCQTSGWCGELERRCQQLSAALKAAERGAHEAWRELVLATRDREALDKLLDKCRRAYDREVQRHEQKELDEMGLRRGDRSWQVGDREIQLSIPISQPLTPNSQLA